MKPTKYSNESIRRIINNLVSVDNVSPTITANAMQSINHQNCVLIKEKGMHKVLEKTLRLNKDKIKDYSLLDCYNVAIKDDIVCTITTRVNASNEVYVCESRKDMRIRKLTPLECLKLQGFSEDDYNAIKDQFSDSAIYHAAGDSISVSVLMGIFGEMTDINYHKAINSYIDTLVERK